MENQPRPNRSDFRYQHPYLIFLRRWDLHINVVFIRDERMHQTSSASRCRVHLASDSAQHPQIIKDLNILS
ncbi:hypothetical protein NDU88_001424 [Pleurodeles waltl]|uniref:Uncharacterized protein n=1 Tax=Pleurodeles waltl TaxID=8319 RepID=A0AAV7R716_PLEWA|nr:hypothetical protein NDU88_001424 [Pleurodeles waltl]